MEIDLEKEKVEILNRYRALLRSVRGKIDTKDKKLIRKAFDLAVDAHKDMRRKSGEPYIFHPIAVAQIVAKEIGLSATSIACALIHDVVEDSEFTLEDIERLFGEKVAKIIDGLTKISGVFDQNVSMQAENFRKMLLTLSDDVRVILIKLADRLHNMRTMDSMPRYKQQKIASETLFLYAPLAHRLGLYSIKTELEDLGLKYTEPEVYRDISTKLAESKKDRVAYINKFSAPLRDSLKDAGLSFTVKGRPKSIFSIRKKMANQEIPFEQVFDKFAIRVILDSTVENEKADCWKAYSIVTDFYRPNSKRLRDWISTPKSNGYESLHTTVMGPKGYWVEVQIRTLRMDEIAEKGYAAHWKYKTDESAHNNNLESWIGKIREMLDNPDGNALDFIDDFKMNLFSDEIFIFTPGGDLKTLPKGASALDFAFEIHSQVGSQCLGAKVNGKLVPLSYTLKSGDQVEILTSIKQRPKEDWLSFVVTAKAKSKIKSSLKDENKLIAADGKEVLQRKLKHLKIVLNKSLTTELLNYFKLQTSLDLFYQVGVGTIENKRLREFVTHRQQSWYNIFRKRFRKTNAVAPEFDTKKTNDKRFLVFGDSEEKLDYILAPCCNPISGDKVFGFTTIKEGIKVHRHDCPNAIRLQANYAYRILKAVWVTSNRLDFIAILRIKGIDKMGLVNEITKLISNSLSINITSLNIAGKDGVFDGRITVKVHDTKHLNILINNIKKVEGVTNVERKYQS